MSQAIKAILDATTSVTDDLANGANSIMHLMEAQGAATNYVILMSELLDPHDTMSGQNLDRWEVSIYIVSKWLYDEGAEVGARSIAENIRTALNGYKGMVGTELIKSIAFEKSNSQFFQPTDTRVLTNNRVIVEQKYQLLINK